MTQLLERVYAQVQQLPEPDQDAIAALILEELQDEQRRQKSFAQSSPALVRLAEEALAEHRAGLTQPLDPERMTAEKRGGASPTPPRDGEGGLKEAKHETV